MQSTKLKPAYKRNLPHIQPLGATFFVTFRLKGSIPWSKVQELRIAYRGRVAEFKAKYGKYANEYIRAERQRFFLQLHRIMNRIKGASARYCNLLLGRTGKFWQRESFDRFIRDEKHLQNVIFYILENPVKAGLAGHWEEWPFSYWKGYKE